LKKENLGRRNYQKGVGEFLMSLNNLKYLREQMGISEADLANKLEMSRQDYEKWENELFPEYTEMLVNVARALHVGVKELIEVTVDEPKYIISIAFPERLKELRKENHLTQVEMANYFGTSQPSYQSWESGRRSPTRKSLEKLAAFFNVSVSYLLGETDERGYTSISARDTKEIGERIKQLRKDNQLTQIEVAKALKTSQPSYQKWEKGVRTPTPRNLEKLATYFNVSIDYLLGRD